MPYADWAAEGLVALCTLDRVYSCPVCGAAVIRTNVEHLDAHGLRCPNRRCRERIALPEPSSLVRARRYQCRGRRCGALLFTSGTESGRAWARCPDCQTLQPVLLGGAPARMIVGQVAVTVGAE